MSHLTMACRIRKRYPQRLVRTPFEKLATLDHVQQFLRRGVTLESLRHQAARISDNEAAARLNEARTQLFISIQTIQKRRFKLTPNPGRSGSYFYWN